MIDLNKKWIHNLSIFIRLDLYSNVKFDRCYFKVKWKKNMIEKNFDCFCNNLDINESYLTKFIA